MPESPPGSDQAQTGLRLCGFFWQRDYLKLFTALACGVILGCSWPLPASILVGDCIPIALFLAALVLLWLLWRTSAEAWVMAPLIAVVVTLGYLDASVQIGLILSQPLRQTISDEAVSLTGHIASMPKYARGHVRFLLQVESVERDERQNGLCYVYLKSPSARLPEGRGTGQSQLCLGERISLWAQLEEVAAPANHGQFDYRAYLMQRGTVLTAYAISPRCLRRLDAHPPMIYALLNQMREHLTANLAAGLPEHLGDLAVSVVYGDKVTDLSDATREQFRRAGLTHILVASGTQVSLLIVMLALLFSRSALGAAARGRYLSAAQFALTLSIVLAYAAITGFETSIVRAFIMGGLVLVAHLANREADGLSTLAQAGIILLLINPLQLYAPGTQLSFGATFGLVYAAGVFFPLIARFPLWPKRIAQTLVTTGGAQLFVAPLLAAQFQQLSVWGLLSNLAAIPLAFMLLLAGGIASLGLSAVPVLGLGLRYCVWALAWTLDRVAVVFAGFPGSNLAVPHPAWWWIVAAYVLLISLGEGVKLYQRWRMSELLLLRAMFGVAALVVTFGVAWWLIVPRPQLVALALNKSEAYLWRPYSGGNYVLARSKGMDKSHNTDTLQSALRWRGINELNGLVWLDNPDLRVAEEITAALPAYADHFRGPIDSDLELINSTGRTLGSRCRLGVDELWILWDEPDSSSTFSALLISCKPAAIVVSQSTWKQLDSELQEELLASAQICVVDTQAKVSAGQQPLFTASELSLQLKDGRLRVQPKPYRTD